MKFSLSPEKKRVLVVFAGLLFFLKLTAFTHASIQAVLRSSGRDELLQYESQGRNQILVDGPRIVPHLTSVSTCCHAHCDGVRSVDYLCACCAGAPVQANSNTPHESTPPGDAASSARSSSAGTPRREDAGSSEHTAQEEQHPAAAAAVEEQRKWHEKHQHHHQQQQADLSRYAHPAQVQQPLHVPEGSVQARPVDAVVQRVMAEKGHKDTSPASTSAVAPSQPAVSSSRHHRATSPETSAHHSEDAHVQSSGDVHSADAQDPEDSYQGPSFVRDERKREKESGLDADTVNDNQGDGVSRSFDREQVWGPMGDSSSYPASSASKAPGARGRQEEDAGQQAAAPGLSVDRRSMRSSNQVYDASAKNPLEDFVGTNIVFHGTSSEGGVPRARRGAGRLHYMLAKANAGTGMLAGNETSGESGGDGGDKKDEKHEFSWDKSWWGEREWLIWSLACPVTTVLIFVNACLGQDVFCACLYMAFLVPMDVLSYYFDVYDYHDDDSSYIIFLVLYIIMDSLLCLCLLPAYAAWSLKNQEKQPFPGQGGTGGGYGATGFGGFQPFHGSGQSTGYGERTATTQMV